MNDLPLDNHPDGIILNIKAQPKARRNGLNGVQAGRLRVQVTQAPENGKANAAIVALLADLFQIAKSQIELLAGETSPVKRFLIRSLDAETVRQALERANH